MTNNYQIRFMALRSGTVYTVYIGGATGAVGSIELKGAASPFVTQEDDSEDMFEPVRRQTGYISIIDDGYAADGVTAFDWKDLVPTNDLDRPVTLIDQNGNVCWKGYMQAQDFSGVLYGSPQERRFPIQCRLSVLDAIDAPATMSGIYNFAYVIRAAVNSQGAVFTRFVFQGGHDARTWLRKKVQWHNFLNEDSDGVVTSKYKYLQVLTDVCQYWGWTCRTYGDHIFFGCIDDTEEPSALVLTANQMEELATSPSASTGSVESSFTSIVTPGDNFASTDNDEMTARGYSNATVHANVNKASHIMTFAPKVVEDILEGTYSWVGEDLRGYFTTPLVNTIDKDIMSGFSLNGAGFCRRQIYTSEESETAETQDMIVVPSVDARSGWLTGSCSLVWKRQMMYNAGRLTINGNVFQGYQIFDAKKEDSWYITMRLGIGLTRQTAIWFKYALNFNTQQVVCEWTSDSSASFMVNISNGRLDGLCALTPLLLTRQYLSYIPIPDNAAMFGNLFIDIMGIEGMSYEIGDFSIDYSRDRVVVDTQGTRGRSMTIDRLDRYDYTASNESRVREDWDFDNIFATDKDGEMAFGYGLVMNEDYSFMQKVTHGRSEKIPEQVLADRVADFWSTSRRMLRAELQSQTISVSPRNTLSMGTAGTFYPLSISRDWHNDVTQILMIEI